MAVVVVLEVDVVVVCGEVVVIVVVPRVSGDCEVVEVVK